MRQGGLSSSPRAWVGIARQVIPMSTPRPTDGPPMAQTSPETDREALVALYNATGGPHWKINNLDSESAYQDVVTNGTGKLPDLLQAINPPNGGGSNIRQVLHPGTLPGQPLPPHPDPHHRGTAVRSAGRLSAPGPGYHLPPRTPAPAFRRGSVQVRRVDQHP